ncbi:hypothetical protein PN499_18415 [Kamptonema animale CS-326]|uniref:hypothetical protein n=1 Tax=Kamptonema animale TaxID=92934 RepID=UPI0023304894|nr:hypothetical protein [Kamptonema animale]MDB9513171.1 hypothetical protein [Kamptonema animale CS-326]
MSLIERSIAIAFLGEEGDWDLWAIAEQIQLKGRSHAAGLYLPQPWKLLQTLGNEL